MARSINWIILTGEYPPQPGGVSDYTRLLALALVEAGDTVHVWAPPSAAPDEPEAGIAVHRLPGHFGPQSRAEMDWAFARLPANTHLLVQYVPHAFGHRAMNLPFCIWLWRRRRRYPISVMFHEVTFPWVKSGRILRHNLLALINRVMAGLAARSARQIYVSIPAWERTLRWLSGGKPVTWLPIPSTMPQTTDFTRVEALRARLCDPGDNLANQRLIGHFGTFGAYTSALLQTLLLPLLRADTTVKFLGLGRGSVEFAAGWRLAHPVLAPRVLAAGELSPEEVVTHLAACDLLVQPYPDGISSRRTSAMASLALGRPILATRGHLTEACWEEGAVRLVDAAEEIPTQASELLANADALAKLGETGTRLYRERFDLRNAVALLRSTFCGCDLSS